LDVIDINAILGIIDIVMPSLLIRRLDDTLKRQLRLRAAENGRSMEEEVRQILRQALGVPAPNQVVEAPPPQEEERRAPEAVAPRRPLQRGGRVRLFGRP
jgi:phosphopantothenoylcysteine decarboxylase/phosphopantothenate--cysteine ligase